MTTPARARQMLKASRIGFLRAFRRHPVPSTVWLCGQVDPRVGTSTIATWLLIAVAKIVTTYTEPGQRVLLLVPSWGGSSRGSGSWVGARTEARRSHYEGLQEASWVVCRLGRGIRSQVVGAAANRFDHRADNQAAESESGFRVAEPDSIDNFAPSPNGRTGLGGGPDRYDLIIAAVAPQTSNSFRPADWVGLLGPEGVLAVITHGNHSHGRFTEPVGSLVKAAQLAGLGYLDRVTIVSGDVSADSIAHEGGSPQRGRWASKATSSHVQAHDDLLVFVHKGSRRFRSLSGEASDD